VHGRFGRPILTFFAQVSPNELISEIRQYLSDEVPTCIYTNYHFECAGKPIKEDAGELIAAVPDLVDGTVLTMVEGTPSPIL